MLAGGTQVSAGVCARASSLPEGKVEPAGRRCSLEVRRTRRSSRHQARRRTDAERVRGSIRSETAAARGRCSEAEGSAGVGSVRFDDDAEGGRERGG